jgi:hypothetical protein
VRVPRLRPFAKVMVVIEALREFAGGLPRSYEAVVRGRLKFRVGRIVYVAFSRDETLMGFAFSREERNALVDTNPDKFQLPTGGDLRYNWVVARLDAMDVEEACEWVLDAWLFVVPDTTAREYLDRADA